MPHQQPQPQWTMAVVISHAPNFGHAIWLSYGKAGREPLYKCLGTWKGLGIPADVLSSARAAVDAIFSEHLVTRYGVADELPMKWAGEPDSH